MSQVSKLIQKETRAILRARRRAAIEVLLHESKSVKSLTTGVHVKKRSLIGSVRDRDGNIQTERNQIAGVFADFYEDLYQSKLEATEAAIDSQPHEEVEPFSMKELEKEIRSLRKRKAKDKAGIIAELLKAGGTALKTALLTLYNAVIKKDVAPPATWKESCVIVLFKDGDPKMPENYRPITLVRLLYKLFTRLLLARIKPVLLADQSVDQA